MSLYQYRQAEELVRQDYGFDTLIMAAFHRADGPNLEKLEREWPKLGVEYRYRFWSGGGLLPNEAGYDPAYDDNIMQQAREILSDE
jgi:hypothetical protein